ncbi:ABC transporter permease [Nibribacter koreensis]|uniref:ABC transporter permease n=1 Tax=Nibribacter koreensis TaxID=1084519 RepID=A0ABP8FEZ0_9BACT
MLKNYLKIAWRNLLRNPVYSAINVVGLATGISACLLIFLFVQHELTYDREIPNSQNIYRIVSNINFQGKNDRFGLSPLPLAEHIKREIPEVKQATRLATIDKQTIWVGQQPFMEDHLVFVDSTFFEVVPHTFLAGNPATALNGPRKIVLSEDLALKFFGSVEDAMGQLLSFTRYTYTVTGVVKPYQHSHLQVNAFLSQATRDEAIRLGKDPAGAAFAESKWLAMAFYTYFTLHTPESLPNFEEKLAGMVKNTIEPWIREQQLSATVNFEVQPIQEIHLDNSLERDISPSGNKAYVYIFSMVALFLLLIACINYMNLATARSAKRAREVGLRKVVGADRYHIIKQFLGESILITLVSLILALAMTELSIPLFNQLTDKQFTLSSFLNLEFILTLLGILLFVGLAAGSYPAFFLSGFRPVEVLKSDKSPRSGNSWLRRTLVVLQFTISLVLIIGTAVVYSQLQFIKNKNLGFDKEQVLAIDLPVGDTTVARHLSVVMEQLKQHPNITAVAQTGNIPGEDLGRILVLAEDKDGRELDKTMNVMFVEPGFLRLLGIDFVEGRGFDKSIPSDEKGAVIINQAAAKWLEYDKPLGKRIKLIDYDAKVIGVTEDFNYATLHSPIEPLIIVPVKHSNGYLLTKIQGKDMAKTVAFIERQWKAFAPKHPVESFFLDDFFDQQYKAEEKMLAIFGYFAILTILIACLGLFGLASFTAEQRTKEIGIRKVLGSTVWEIVLLLSKDFALLVLVAIALALPLAWLGMQYWLQDFAYQVQLSVWLFVLASLGALVIALTTVGIQAARAALLNPIQALRSE